MSPGGRGPPDRWCGETGGPGAPRCAAGRVFAATGARLASAQDTVANKTKELEAKRMKLAELEVATLVAAHALKKGKAAAAEECRASEAQVLEARASISASLAAAVPDLPDSLDAELHSIATVMTAIEEETSASFWTDQGGG